MSKFLVVHMVSTGKKREIKKSDITGISVDEFKGDDESQR